MLHAWQRRSVGYPLNYRTQRRSFGLSRPESLDRTVTQITPSNPLGDLAKRDGLPMAWLVLSFVVASLAIFTRCPSLLTHAQFYAEDGVHWYAQAYNDGWLQSLLLPSLGYLQTLQRFAAGLALLAPFRWAPLIMTTFGLIWQALPVPVLLSRRCRRWAPLPMRIGFA